MSDRALYFPYIEVPEGPEVNRLMLYWDVLGSIVPRSVRRSGGGLSDRMRALMDAGLIEPVHPEEVDSFELNERFLDVVDEWHRRWSPTAGRARPVRVHLTKGSDRFWYGLERRRLARKRTRDWMEVDGRVAAAYLAALARDIGRFRGMEPVTDRSSLFEVNGLDAPSTAAVFAEMRAVVLDNVLPSPTSSVSVQDLVDFKSEHQQELRAFRAHVEQGLVECAQADETLRERAVDALREKTEAALTVLEDAMHERRWVTKNGVLCAVVSGGAAGSLVGTTRGAGAGAVAAAVTAGADLLRSAITSTNPTPEGPLAYAALARRALA